MKKIFKRGVPLFMALLVLLGVTFTSFESVNATGAEEFLYYTYWDLMTSVFAAQGYDMQIKDGVVNDHGVTGKQVWENFKTWVKTNAFNVYSEAVTLPKAVTAEGIKMSQELWNAFKDYAKSFRSDVVSFKNLKEVQNILASATGLPASTFTGSCVNRIASGKDDIFCLQFINTDGSIYGDYLYVFGLPAGSKFIDFDWNYYGSHMVYSLNDVTDKYLSVLEISTRDMSNIRAWDYSDRSWTFRDYQKDCAIKWIIKGNSVVASDGVYSLVSQGACPAEVPDVTPWIKNPVIPDEWRIVQPGEDPKKDPDSNPEKLPVIIPFKPPKPEDPKKPDSTEDTNPDKDKDKDKEKKPAVNPIINPETGNVIDPETGLDIDPNTGKLIDPDTGKLIDPDDGGSGGGGGGGIADKLGKYGDITKLFPFCIPFDIVNLIKGMSAEKAPPVFHFKYYFKSINYTFKVDVDLSQYAKYIKLFRYGMQIFYILALMFMTIRISKLFS